MIIFVVLPIKLTPDGNVEPVCDDIVLCQTEAEMKEEIAAQLDENAKINVAAIQAAGCSTVSFTTSQVLSNGERSIACDQSGQICFARYKWQHRPAKESRTLKRGRYCCRPYSKHWRYRRRSGDRNAGWTIDRSFTFSETEELGGTRMRLFLQSLGLLRRKNSDPEHG